MEIVVYAALLFVGSGLVAVPRIARRRRGASVRLGSARGVSASGRRTRSGRSVALGWVGGRSGGVALGGLGTASGAAVSQLGGTGGEAGWRGARSPAAHPPASGAVASDEDAWEDDLGWVEPVRERRRESPATPVTPAAPPPAPAFPHTADRATAARATPPAPSSPPAADRATPPAPQPAPATSHAADRATAVAAPPTGRMWSGVRSRVPAAGADAVAAGQPRWPGEAVQPQAEPDANPRSDPTASGTAGAPSVPVPSTADPSTEPTRPTAPARAGGAPSAPTPADEEPEEWLAGEDGDEWSAMADVPPPRIVRGAAAFAMPTGAPAGARQRGTFLSRHPLVLVAAYAAAGIAIVVAGVSLLSSGAFRSSEVSDGTPSAASVRRVPPTTTPHPSTPSVAPSRSAPASAATRRRAARRRTLFLRERARARRAEARAATEARAQARAAARREARAGRSRRSSATPAASATPAPVASTPTPTTAVQSTQAPAPRRSTASPCEFCID